MFFDRYGHVTQSVGLLTRRNSFKRNEHKRFMQADLFNNGRLAFCLGVGIVWSFRILQVLQRILELDHQAFSDSWTGEGVRQKPQLPTYAVRIDQPAERNKAGRT